MSDGPTVRAAIYATPARQVGTSITHLREHGPAGPVASWVTWFLTGDPKRALNAAADIGGDRFRHWQASSAEG